MDGKTVVRALPMFCKWQWTLSTIMLPWAVIFQVAFVW